MRNRALEECDKALDLLGEHLPSFCLWRAETLCAKGGVLVSLGRLNEAESVGSDALSILEALPGAQIDLGRCLNLLGIVELSKGELSKACATFDRGIALVRAATEESRPSEVVDCLAGLLEDRGFALFEMGLCEEALRNQREALEAARELVARDAARFRYQLTRALMYAGMTEQRLGRFADAERHQREALLSYRELSGRDAQRCGERLSIALSELGKTCWLAGRPHEAEPLLRNSIELARPLQEHAFLRCGPLIVNSLSYLSGVVAELGHDDEAEGYDREALAIARRLYALQPTCTSGPLRTSSIRRRPFCGSLTLTRQRSSTQRSGACWKRGLAPGTKSLSRCLPCVVAPRDASTHEKSAVPDKKGRDPGAPALAVALSAP